MRSDFSLNSVLYVSCMYGSVYMVSTFSRVVDQPNMVENPACGQLKRGEKFTVPVRA